MLRNSTVVALALVALAGCATPEVRVPVSAPLAEVPYAAPPMGRQFTQRNQDGRLDVWTVAEIDGEQVVFDIDGGRREVMPTPFWSSVEWRFDSTTGHSRNEGDPKALYPLRIGSRAEWTRVGVNKGQPFNSQVRCEVKDQVRVAVPAGEFDTYEVACTSGSNREQPSATNTYFFAPSINHPVKFARRTQDRKDEWGFELVSLTDPG